MANAVKEPGATRNSEATKRRIVAAAIEEFANHGLAGARVDRIATRAKANKGLIYAYFGDKEQLFTRVLQNVADEFNATIPFDSENLAHYAEQVYLMLVKRPDLRRLTRWERLERDDFAIHTESYKSKLAQVERAQSEGKLTCVFSGPDFIALVLGIASAWADASPALHAFSESIQNDAHRKAVVDAVQGILQVGREA